MRGVKRFSWWAWFAVIALPSVVAGLYYMGGSSAAVLDFFFGLHYMLWPLLAPVGLPVKGRSPDGGPDERGFLWISTASAASAILAPHLGVPIPPEFAAIGLVGLGLVAATEVAQRLVRRHRRDAASERVLHIFGPNQSAWIVFIGATSVALVVVVPPISGTLSSEWILLFLGLYPVFHLLMRWVESPGA